MINLIKYNNRKVYSKELRRYVTALEVHDMIIKYDNITIIGHRTGEDVTYNSLYYMGAVLARRGYLEEAANLRVYNRRRG